MDLCLTAWSATAAVGVVGNGIGVKLRLNGAKIEVSHTKSSENSPLFCIGLNCFLDS